MGAVSAVDGFQRRHPVLGFPLAVIYKYFDDQGPYLASALTYYAFIAIFPLMLLGTSILGLILRGEPQWQEQILNSALSQFPIIGDELGRPEGLQGSVTGVAVGAIAALYGAMGLGQA
ncbi:MAG TPA: YhjD/YihY/BrkB family envelope integrity protein, partial [Nocardioides sp.]|nr:YhjD/YihY/BrkB family envelope integrity protein [Nocardioides sp.]